MQDVKYFRCEIENGKTYISARSQPQYVLGPDGWIDLHEDAGEGMDEPGLDVNAKASANVAAFAEEPVDLGSTYDSQQGLHADVILEAEVGLEDIGVYGRNEAIQAAEVAAGINPKLLREMVWVEGAEDIPGVIVLPQDDYKRVYVLEGSRDNPTVRFVPEKNEAGGVRPYYEKPGDGKTYIYVDGFSGGSGTQEDPYLIHDVYELQAMKNNLNAHYALAQDIDASETVNWNDGAGFEPIGTSSSRFSGSFNGRGYKITGLYINRGSTDYVGLFGRADFGTIQHVGLVDGTIVGRNYTGGVVGWFASGSVIQCYNTGSVTGGTYTGGIVGNISGSSSTVRKCYNTGSVAGGTSTGGVVGYVSSGASVTQCYNTGSVTGQNRTGGVIGYQSSTSSTVRECYNTGSVAGGSETGGVVGALASGTISSCYWNTETSGVSTGVGSGSASGVFGKTTAEMMQQATYVGWDFDDVWFIKEGDGYPQFKWEFFVEKELRAPGMVIGLRVVELVSPGIVRGGIGNVLDAPGIVRGSIGKVLDVPGIVRGSIMKVLDVPGIVQGGIGTGLAAPGIVRGGVETVLDVPGIVQADVETVLAAPGIVQGGIVAGMVAPGIVQADVNIERVAPGVVRGGIETVLVAPLQMDVRIRRRARAPLVVNPKVRRIRRWPLEIQALYWWRVPKPPGTFGGD